MRPVLLPHKSVQSAFLLPLCGEQGRIVPSKLRARGIDRQLGQWDYSGTYSYSSCKLTITIAPLLNDNPMVACITSACVIMHNWAL